LGPYFFLWQANSPSRWMQRPRAPTASGEQDRPNGSSAPDRAHLRAHRQQGVALREPHGRSPEDELLLPSASDRLLPEAQAPGRAAREEHAGPRTWFVSLPRGGSATISGNPPFM